MKGMKVFRGSRWTFQCYWPQVWCGGLGSYGIRASSGFIFTRHKDGGWAAGLELIGLGFGVMHTPAAGVKVLPEPEPSVREQTLAGLVKRLAWLVPKDHAARIAATECLQRYGYLSPLRADDSGVLVDHEPNKEGGA